MIEYKDNYAFFNGFKFRKDTKTGYYLNSNLRKRLHRYIWEFYNGEIPKGCQVHHKDAKKNNNDIDNLEILATSVHQQIHGLNRMSNMEWYQNFRQKGIESAKIWHKSIEGREWHKKHYQENKEKLHKKIIVKCENCNQDYEAAYNNYNKFCSNKCKSAWRRKTGVDNEIRKCDFCQKEFATNKYKKQKYCSGKCSKGKKNNF